MMRPSRALAVALLWLSASTAPHADAEPQTRVDGAVSMPVENPPPISKPSESATLEKIRTLGAVYLGYRETAVPFSYHNDGRAAGYSVELCYRIVDAIKARLGRSDIKTVEVPLPGNLRFTMLVDGVVDLECGVSSNTKIRQQRMAFSVTTFVSGVKMLVAKESKFDRITDLDRKRVAIISGTTAGRSLTAVAGRRNVGLTQIQVRDRGEAFELLKAGKVDAFVGDDALLLGVLLKDPERDKFRLMEESLATEPYGIVLRREDPVFKQLVDETLIGLMKSGEIETIYNRWFVQPIAPYGKSMDLPPTPMLKLLFANPNDAGG